MKVKMCYFYTIMEFEFDPAKSASNEQKHGINFDQAQPMWNDPDGLVIPSTSKTELRQLLIARIGEKLWTAVFTQRGKKLRIISVRRARDNERNRYDSE